MALADAKTSTLHGVGRRENQARCMALAAVEPGALLFVQVFILPPALPYPDAGTIGGKFITSS